MAGPGFFRKASAGWPVPGSGWGLQTEDAPKPLGLLRENIPVPCTCQSLTHRRSAVANMYINERWIDYTGQEWKQGNHLKGYWGGPGES